MTKSKQRKDLDMNIYMDLKKALERLMEEYDLARKKQEAKGVNKEVNHDSKRCD